MTKDIITEYTHEYCLTAAQCNGQREVSPATLVQQLIDVATEHADILNIGFKRMDSHNSLWVLSRVAYEISRYPRSLEAYAITTWVEGYNKLFSNRNFAIRDAEGELLGEACTIWMGIDKDTRRPIDLSVIADESIVRPDIECAMERPGKIRVPAELGEAEHYHFAVSDIDFNRHVTSHRYVELAIDQKPLEWYDANVLSRFEIAYSHESLCGERVKVMSGEDARTGAMVSVVEGAEGEQKCLTRAWFTPRNK